MNRATFHRTMEALQREFREHLIPTHPAAYATHDLNVSHMSEIPEFLG